MTWLIVLAAVVVCAFVLVDAPQTKRAATSNGP